MLLVQVTVPIGTTTGDGVLVQDQAGVTAPVQVGPRLGSVGDTVTVLVPGLVQGVDMDMVLVVVGLVEAGPELEAVPVVGEAEIDHHQFLGNNRKRLRQEFLGSNLRDDGFYVCTNYYIIWCVGGCNVSIYIYMFRAYYIDQFLER